jgi:hypothetical protein
MLEGLNAVDWASLFCAYGDASGVPHMLRCLASPDEGAREEALGHLYSSILHQGTYYPATAPTMSFVVELLQAPGVPGKKDLLRFLAGAAEVEVMGKEFLDYLKQRAAGRDPGLVGAAAEHFRTYPEPGDTFDAVRASLPVYLDFLGHADRPVRLAAARLVRVVASPSENLAARLFAHLRGEPDPVIRVVHLFALRDAGDANLLPYLVDELLLDSDLSAPLRWAAAVVVAHWAGGGCHPDAMSLLSDALLDPEFRQKELSVPLAELDPPFDGPVNVEWHVIIAETCRALERVPKAAALPTFLAATSTVPGSASYSLLRSLHRRFFGGVRVPRNPADWTEEQRAVLRSLAESETLWDYYAFPGDLAAWGLPRGRAGFQEYLRRAQADCSEPLDPAEFDENPFLNMPRVVEGDDDIPF